MSNIDIIRAWKDEEYRNSLSEEERSQLPENPAGMMELSDENMESIAGGYIPRTFYINCGFPREFFAPPKTYFILGCNVFPNG